MGPGLTFFETIMLVCFGISWPFAIAKTLRTKSVTGASGTFYILILVGYIAGIIHKVQNNLNFVVFFYALNAFMVAMQLTLLSVYRNRKPGDSTPPLGITDTGRLG
jgi:hypothetical protein